MHHELAASKYREEVPFKQRGAKGWTYVILVKPKGLCRPVHTATQLVSTYIFQIDQPQRQFSSLVGSQNATSSSCFLDSLVLLPYARLHSSAAPVKLLFDVLNVLREFISNY